MLRTTAARDTGKYSVSLIPEFSGMPFKEQQLKQLRAQCLVFLALRNGLVPKKLHLEIALGVGDIFAREGGNVDSSCRELIDTVKAQSSNDPSSTPGVVAPLGRLSNARETDRTPPGASSSGRFLEADEPSKKAEKSKMIDKSGSSQVQPCGVSAPANVASPDQKPVEQLDHVVQSVQAINLSATHDSASRSSGPTRGQVPSLDLDNVASDVEEILSENSS